ncbi:MAG TPA: P-loop NTPase fold protein [bacterium]|jgi:hypothetical protein
MTDESRTVLDFDSDQPKTDMKDDALGRTGYARYLGDSILSYKSTDSLVVGIYDEWGSGKTTLINFALQHIRKKTAGHNDRPVVIHFSPWLFSTSEALVSAFFKTLSQNLKRQDWNAELQKAGALVSSYAAFFAFLSYVPQDGMSHYWVVGSQMLFAAASVLKKSGKVLKRDLETRRTALSKVLRDQPSKVIIVIDDLDRLPDEEVRQIFQLVRSMADFPNTVYLLAFDPKPVAKALDKSQDGCGNKYLEKIIQAPFVVPKATPEALSSYVGARIRALQEEAPAERRDKNDRLFSILDWNAFHLIQNLRHANRFLNILTFNFDRQREHINFADIVGLSVLQVFCEPVYRGIRDNHLIFRRTISAGLRLPDTHAKESIKSVVEGLFAQIIPEHRKYAEGILFELFPDIGAICNKPTGGPHEEEDDLRTGRICHPENYNRALAFDVPEGETTDAEASTLWDDAADLEMEQLTGKLGDLCRTHEVSQLFRRLAAKAPVELQQNTAIKVIAACLLLWEQFSEDESVIGGYPSDATGFVARVLRRFPDSIARGRVLRDGISYASGCVWPIGDLVRRIKVEGSPASGASLYDTPLALQTYADCKGIARGRIQAAARDGLLWSHPHFYYILRAWHDFGGTEDVREFISRETSRDGRLLELLDRLPLTKESVPFLGLFMDIPALVARLDTIVQAGIGSAVYDRIDSVTRYLNILRGSQATDRGESPGEL